MSSRQTRLRELMLLTGLCGFFFFFRLSAIGLLGPDEPRYAQVAREMLARGDWVTPVLYHHHWLEKPILLYWGEMLAYRIFGVCDWAARLPSAVAATLLVCGSFFAVRRIRHAARLDAALMVASSVLVLGFARAASTDMLLASFLCLSLLAWFLWYQANYDAPGEGDAGKAGRRARAWLLAAYALNALAALAKGPVAPGLAFLVLLAFCALRRNFAALRRTLWPAGIALFFAVAAPWYVLVQMRAPEFFHLFFLEQNLARFGTNLYRHRQPFWFYLPVTLAATLPWTVWLFQGLADAVSALRGSTRQQRATAILAEEASSGNANAASGNPESNAAPEPGFAFELFLFVWALVPIVFFSISRSKLPGYILPSVPALVILAAVAVHRRAARGERPRPLPVVAHAALLGGLAAGGCLAPQLAFKHAPSPAAMLLAALAGSVIFLITALPLLSRGWRYLHFVTLLPVVLAVGLILRGLAPALDATRSARPVAALVARAESTVSLPVCTFSLGRNSAFGLAFYLNRRVDPYEGLEISPAVYELPPAVPRTAHLLVTREGSLPSLRLLLAGRRLRLVASYAPQRLEIFRVSPVDSQPTGAAPSESQPSAPQPDTPSSRPKSASHRLPSNS